MNALSTPTLEREVAVKLMKRGVAEDPKGLENFIHEARACGSLNHTNIIHIYTFDESDGERYLVMELADCGSLDNRIEREQRVSELDVLDIGIQVASALAAALKRNILHRDIKPAIFSSMRMANRSRSISASPGKPRLIISRKRPFGARLIILLPRRSNGSVKTFNRICTASPGTLYHALTGHVPFEAPSIAKSSRRTFIRP